MKQLKAITQNIGGKEDSEDWRKDWMKDSSNESTWLMKFACKYMSPAAFSDLKKQQSRC